MVTPFDPTLLRGTIKTLVLQLLRDNPRSYGYEIVKEVDRRTESRIQLTEGALYPVLRQLLESGLVTMEEERVNNRPRRYYQLTERGEVVAEERTVELLEFLRTLAVFVRGGS